MGDSKTSVFILDLILLIVFFGLVLITFQFTGLFFMFELLALAVLLFFAFIAIVATYFRANWGWVLTSIILALVIVDLLFILFWKSPERGVFYLVLVASCLGFLISIVQIERREEIDKEPVVLKTYSPGKYVASKKGSVFHAPKCDWAHKIGTKNQVWFKSTAAAKNKGYKKHDCIR